MAAPALTQRLSEQARPHLVPYAAGGAVDVLARTLGQSLSKPGQQRYRNRPGPADHASRRSRNLPRWLHADPVAAASAEQFFYPKLPYDTFKDFTAQRDRYSPLAIVVSKTVRERSRELLAARAPNLNLVLRMSGNGTSAHLAGESSLHGQGQDHHPYKGGALPSRRDRR